MDVLFFNPPRTRQADDHVLNMALLWLASSLRAGGHEAGVRMPSGASLDEDVATAIERERPRYVAIACKWWNTLYGALQVAGVVRRRFPRLPIIMGGHTASTFPAELIATGLVDIVLVGDVDASLPLLVSQGTVSNGFTAAGYHPPVAGAVAPMALDEVRLDPVATLIDRPDQVPGYVWLGRGCSYPCFYCIENRESGRRILGRGAPRMRRVAAVAADAAALAGRSQLIFDYEHPSLRRTEAFLRDLGAALPAGFESCYYFHWGLPTPAIIDTLSERFAQVGICFDVQVFAEDHRRRLAGQRLIKPHVTDAAIRSVLRHAEARGNVHVDATGIVGMPWETADHRARGLAFIEDLSREFGCVRDWRFSPLHVIPGTPLAQEPAFHGLAVERRTFADFLAFTQEGYDREARYYDPAGRTHHPYGVYPQGERHAIVDFMAEADGRLGALRADKRRTTVVRDGPDAAITVTDPFAPLPSLAAALSSPAVREAPVDTLTLTLGPRTWFHGSWIDYTSESGENSATRCGLDRDARRLEAFMTERLAACRRVRLTPAPGRWGIIADTVAGLPAARPAAKRAAAEEVVRA
ncbi:radical SAM superfamily enzyme YgiQ (UPF0313 family) [Azospirillum fermentarium]|uniref:B12-binding domain-containing radical SAM protein n=1 Tax=Azospirillum fermentarium TaxID=1233114 RepID=UPI0022269EE1|nr:cobalamin-dependent protein [Azospirillum fermentarium]MCW2247714.1 radical SAM superfamily enzyme YgiQ (UPF0313 family) [Azospirillum fermentarium]